MENYLIPDMGQEKSTVSMGCFLGLESRGVLKDQQGNIKSTEEHTERGSSWPNVTQLEHQKVEIVIYYNTLNVKYPMSPLWYLKEKGMGEEWFVFWEKFQLIDKISHFSISNVVTNLGK